MIDLKNKTALITGGSRGIGKACVRYLSRAGADVAGSVSFLASELASHITGSVINVNGGSVL